MSNLSPTSCTQTKTIWQQMFHALAFMAAVSTAAAFCLMLPINAQPAYADDGIPMHRLYNPNSGEHFYTANEYEKDSVVDAGWRYEGVGWFAPATGDDVYRLYNPYGGEHHYTLNPAERDMLVNEGWNFESVGWKSSGSIPLYRQYNPNAFANNHNYTANVAEHEHLIGLGWRDEGIAWYGVKEGYSVEDISTKREKVLDSTNNYRAIVQTSPVVLDDSLNKAAQVRAEELAKMPQLTHERPDGADWRTVLPECGIDIGVYGNENLCKGPTTVESAMNNWMNSEEYRGNIQNLKHNKMGLGVAQSPDGTYYWVLIFTS